MEVKENTKLITFRELYRGETYVAFAEDKTELYIFKKFLNWVSWYSHSVSNYFYVLNKDNLTKIVSDFETFLSLSGSFKYCEYGSEEANLKVVAQFYREDGRLPTNLHRGSRSRSISVDFEVTIPSLQDGNILHEDLAHRYYTVIITNLEDVRYLEDY